MMLILPIHEHSICIKIVEENISNKITDISHNNSLSDASPQARETKEKTNKWDYIKLKRFCITEGNFDKTKRQPTEWEKISTDPSDKELLSKIYKGLIKLNTKKPNDPIKK